MKEKMPFCQKNYTFMIIGICIIISGLYIMTLDKTTFGFGVVGLTVGPMVLLFGFLFQFIAIFYKKKQK